ncbi:peptidylprolyl isomerase [Thomasclavelia spiroformis]|jgi:foldase protein PrsA|uniref:peptidylprolyl isomerase n=1 Tax=Thomasclavelia spiroformis TaxID=29348 RepID=UPI00241E0FEA|nr:peptidylprolyl isomerase [Thomasclavelia spiroformis]
MKLGKCATALVVTSFLLTGCSNSNTVKEDGKYVVASLSKGKSDKNIFADDIFADITNTNRGKSAYFEAILQKLMDDKFPTDKDMEIDASRTVEQIQTYYEAQYGDQAKDQIKTVLASSGYSTLDEYEKAMVQAYQKSNFLLDYVKNNFDEVFDDYYTYATPRFASIIKVSIADSENPTQEETAKIEQISAALASGTSFGEVATQYSDDSTTKVNKGGLGVVDTTSGLSSTYGSEVESKIFELNAGEVSEAISGTDGYYFVSVTSTDKKEIKKSIKKNLTIDTPLIAYDSYLPYIVYQSYDVKYEDKDVEKTVNSIIETALQERETSRGGTE